MWSRVIEAMLGCWLAISPFVFRIDPEDAAVWIVNLVSAPLIIIVALLSYWPPTRHAHFVTTLISILLVAYGRFGGPSPGPPEFQNLVLVGLLLLMFSLVPNHASRPPRRWSEASDLDSPENSNVHQFDA
jgi:hypothetical protein